MRVGDGMRGLGLAALAGLSLAGCSSLWGFETLVAGDAGGGGDAAPVDAAQDGSSADGPANDSSADAVDAGTDDVKTHDGEAGAPDAPTTYDSGSMDSGAALDSGPTADSGDAGTEAGGCTATSCTDQTCVSGVCVGVCAQGQDHQVACGNCGVDIETCSATGTWQSSGTCIGQGACAHGATQACNGFGTQTCSSTCGWSTCSCSSPPSSMCQYAGEVTCQNATTENVCDACGQVTIKLCSGGNCPC